MANLSHLILPVKDTITGEVTSQTFDLAGSGGHTIKDSTGTSLTQRTNLKFNNATVVDDPTNNATIVTPDSDPTNFVGTLAEWEALTQAEKDQYDSVDLTDDYYDVTPDIETLMDNDGAILNVLGSKNLLPNNATTQTVGGVTYTINSDDSITVSGTASGSNSYVDLITNLSLPNGKYTLSCEGTDGYVYTYALIDDTRYNANEGSVDFVINDNVITRVRLVSVNGYPTSTITVKPMIRPASIADDTYVPYAMTNRELTNVQEEISTGITLLMAIRTGKVVTLNTNGNGIANLSNTLQLPSSLIPKYAVRTTCVYYNGSGWSLGWISISVNGVLTIYAGSLTTIPNLCFSISYELANP